MKPRRVTAIMAVYVCTLWLFTPAAQAFYNPSTGRWLSRDPIESSNPYTFVGNNAPYRYDFLGLWATDVHYAATKRWAVANSYPNDAAELVGLADEAVDQGRTAPMPWGDQSYHFNRNLNGGKDSRLQHFEIHKGNAERLCTIRTGYDLPHSAAVELGTGLHPLQDWVAHGDYGIYMTPTVWVHHNSFSPQRQFGYPGNYPDMTWLDAVGSDDGRAAGTAMRYIGSSVIDYAIFTPGIQRWKLTKEKTDKALAEFRNYVRDNGGCECKRYFGIEQ